jgi:hypothetical protein
MGNYIGNCDTCNCSKQQQTVEYIAPRRKTKYHYESNTDIEPDVVEISICDDEDEDENENYNNNIINP